MRVKIKGFEPGRSYGVYSQGNIESALLFSIFFSKRNFVYLEKFVEKLNKHKIYKISKRELKQILSKHRIELEEYPIEDFFTKLEYQDEDYYDYYCLNDTYDCGCCICCGCSCVEHEEDEEPE